MRRSERYPVAIIGAGLAGLTAATFLRRQGIPIRLYEAGPKVAGLATSFHDADGFTYDFGAHFITNRLAAALGVGAQCRTVASYGERVWLKGRSYGYPLGLLSIPRFVRDGLVGRLVPKGAVESAADWFRANYGAAFADEVAIPLVEAWSGAPAPELAPSVGEKLGNSVWKVLQLKLASWRSGRAVACGYSQEMPESPDVWHVYPEGGLGLLCQRLAAGLDDEIRLDSPVDEILVNAGRVRAIRVKGTEQPVSAVVSTAPCHILAKLVRGTEALRPLARFRYRPMAFVNLRFEGRGILPDTVLWIPDRNAPFFRLTETPLSMPWLAPEGKTLVTADLGCEVGDARWRMSDEALGALCVDHLDLLFPRVRERYRGCRVLRTPIAYPMYLKEYEADRRRFEQSSGVEGLISIGRNGQFAHALMEDVYWRTLKSMRDLLVTLDAPSVVPVESRRAA
ncbi:MAG TPA: FAD-dependent oxidoreductase [Planctomycetota bacterium]|jgi:protoporphyrinogen oxidase|nr:FAD-dependent oxidoreductase [Planctomycetota bacterium]